MVESIKRQQVDYKSFVCKPYMVRRSRSGRPQANRYDDMRRVAGFYWKPRIGKNWKLKNENSLREQTQEDQKEIKDLKTQEKFYF